MKIDQEFGNKLADLLSAAMTGDSNLLTSMVAPLSPHERAIMLCSMTDLLALVLGMAGPKVVTAMLVSLRRGPVL